MDLGFTDKVVVITGGSSGIGLATARRFAEEGANVFICARRADVLEQAAAEIREATGRPVGTGIVDVTRVDDIDKLRDMVQERYGRIDVLVNNAGTGIYKPFVEVTDEELTTGMAMNFFSQFRVSQRFVKMMIAQQSGVIVNMTGGSGMQILDEPFYSTCTGPAKAAEIRFTKALAAEVGKHNIRVNCIAPGFVNAPERFDRWQKLMPNDSRSAEELQYQWGGRIRLPNRRWATLDEVANTILFAASDAASYTTGAVFLVDGGFDRG